MVKQPPPPSLHYAGLDAKTTSPVPVLLPGGGITILSGATGMGKTALVAGMVRTIINGEGEILGCPVQPTAKKVGLICTDRDWAEAQHWYNTAGVIKSPQFSAYCLQDDYGIKWLRFNKPEQHLDLFNECLNLLELPPHSLVVVDPISPFLGSNLNDYSKTFAAIGPLNQALKKRQLTAIGLHHVMKMKKDPNNHFVRPQDRILGSTAIASFTNTQIYLVGPEELSIGKKTPVTHYLIGFVPHNSKGKEFTFRRDEQGLFIPTGEAATEIMPIEGTEDEVAELLSLFPTIGPIQTAKLDDKATAYFIAAGKPKTVRTLQRWRRTLEEKKLIYSPSKGLWMRESSRPAKEEEEVAQ